jgi:hypothetical protein
MPREQYSLDIQASSFNSYIELEFAVTNYFTIFMPLGQEIKNDQIFDPRVRTGNKKTIYDDLLSVHQRVNGVRQEHVLQDWIGFRQGVIGTERSTMLL